MDEPIDDEDIESDNKVPKNVLADPRAMQEFSQERRSKKNFVVDDETYIPETSKRNKKRRVKHMVKRSLIDNCLVDESDVVEVVKGTTPELINAPKADKTLEFEVNLDDAIDHLLKNPKNTPKVDDDVHRETPKADPKVSQLFDPKVYQQSFSNVFLQRWSFKKRRSLVLERKGCKSRSEDNKAC